MTVGELAAILAKADQDLPVLVQGALDHWPSGASEAVVMTAKPHEDTTWTACGPGVPRAVQVLVVR